MIYFTKVFSDANKRSASWTRKNSGKFFLFSFFVKVFFLVRLSFETKEKKQEKSLSLSLIVSKKKQGS
jgi:hypothetical protein